jgi:catechol 2,3-dioxygenase-like lactoylglutathione lyase family enzyme
MKTYGMRHVALNVKNAQASKAFYCKVFNMQVEWEPDATSVYLTSQDENGGGIDNLALHQSDAPLHKAGFLNHIGFFVPTLEDADAWYAHVQACGAKIVKEIKTHRDGARSFYFEDIDGIVIQLLYHPPVSEHERKKLDSK